MVDEYKILEKRFVTAISNSKSIYDFYLENKQSSDPMWEQNFKSSINDLTRAVKNFSTLLKLANDNKIILDDCNRNGITQLEGESNGIIDHQTLFNRLQQAIATCEECQKLVDDFITTITKKIHIIETSKNETSNNQQIVRNFDIVSFLKSYSKETEKQERRTHHLKNLLKKKDNTTNKNPQPSKPNTTNNPKVIPPTIDNNYGIEISKSDYVLNGDYYLLVFYLNIWLVSTSTYKILKTDIKIVDEKFIDEFRKSHGNNDENVVFYGTIINYDPNKFLTNELSSSTLANNFHDLDYINIYYGDKERFYKSIKDEKTIVASMDTVDNTYLANNSFKVLLNNIKFNTESLKRIFYSNNDSLYFYSNVFTSFYNKLHPVAVRNYNVLGVNSNFHSIIDFYSTTIGNIMNFNNAVYNEQDKIVKMNEGLLYSQYLSLFIPIKPLLASNYPKNVGFDEFFFGWTTDKTIDVSTIKTSVGFGYGVAKYNDVDVVGPVNFSKSLDFKFHTKAYAIPFNSNIFGHFSNLYSSMGYQTINKKIKNGTNKGNIDGEETSSEESISKESSSEESDNENTTETDFIVGLMWNPLLTFRHVLGVNIGIPIETSKGEDIILTSFVEYGVPKTTKAKEKKITITGIAFPYFSEIQILKNKQNKYIANRDIRKDSILKKYQAFLPIDNTVYPIPSLFVYKRKRDLNVPYKPQLGSNQNGNSSNRVVEPELDEFKISWLTEGDKNDLGIGTIFYPTIKNLVDNKILQKQETGEYSLDHNTMRLVKKQFLENAFVSPHDLFDLTGNETGPHPKMTMLYRKIITNNVMPILRIFNEFLNQGFDSTDEKMFEWSYQFNKKFQNLNISLGIRESKQFKFLELQHNPTRSYRFSEYNLLKVLAYTMSLVGFYIITSLTFRMTFEDILELTMKEFM